MGNAFSTEELSPQEIGELVAFDSSGHGAAVGRRAVGVAMAMAMVVDAGGCGVRVRTRSFGWIGGGRWRARPVRPSGRVEEVEVVSST